MLLPLFVCCLAYREGNDQAERLLFFLLNFELINLLFQSIARFRLGIEGRNKDKAPCWFSWDFFCFFEGIRGVWRGTNIQSNLEYLQHLAIILSSFLTVKSRGFLLVFFLWSFLSDSLIPQTTAVSLTQLVIMCNVLDPEFLIASKILLEVIEDFWVYPSQRQWKSTRMILSPGKG